MSKLKETISTEELIKVMQEEGVPEEGNLRERLFSSNNFLYFVDFYNIKNGTDLISVMDLYNLYKHWSKNSSINIVHFKKTVYQLLDKSNKHSKKGYYLAIDLDALKLSDKAKNVLFNEFEKSPKFKSKLYTEEIKTFLNDIGIVTGKYAVPLTTIYYMFRYWTDKSNHISITMFDEYLKYSINHDKKHKLNNDTIFYIDKESLRIDGATLEKAKAFTEKYKKESTDEKYKEIKKGTKRSKKKKQKI